MIMAIPMYLLYEGGLIMARIMVKMRAEDAAKRAKEEEAEA
jgi:Sec-independent protein secretion pathway component TatC